MNYTPTEQELKELGFEKQELRTVYEAPSKAKIDTQYQDFTYTIDKDCIITFTRQFVPKKDIWYLELHSDYRDISISSKTDLETLIRILK